MENLDHREKDIRPHVAHNHLLHPNLLDMEQLHGFEVIGGAQSDINLKWRWLRWVKTLDPTKLALKEGL
jgi:hypothetical protein